MKYLVFFILVSISYLFIRCNNDNDNNIVEYSEDKTLKFEGKILNKLRTGVYYKYDLNGNLKRVINVKDDKRHGIEEVYFENGNLKERISFVNNRKVGKMTLFYENGELREEREYESLGKFIPETNYFYLKKGDTLEVKYEDPSLDPRNKK